MANHQSVIIRLVALNLIVAGSGFLKDVMLAAYLGTGAVAASFGIAYYFPDTIGNGMVGAALLIASTTVFSRMQIEQKSGEVDRFFKRLLGVVAILFGLLAIGLFLLRRIIMNVLLGHVPYLFQATVLLGIMTPLLLIYPFQYVFSGFLQSHHRFILANSTSAVLSIAVGIIAFALLLLKQPAASGAIAISIAIPFAVFMNTLALWIACFITAKAERDKPNGQLQESTKNYGRELRQTFLWFFLYQGVTQMVGFVERGVAARIDTAMLAGLTYAYRVAQVPLWVFIAAITTWILPSLSKAVSAEDRQGARNIMVHGIKLALLVSVPAEILLVILSSPIVDVLFARGAFDATSVWITAQLLKGYALAIMPLSVSVVLFRYYAAHLKMRSAVSGAFAGALVNMGFDIWFAPRVGPMGLGIGSAIGNGLNMLLLMFILRWIKLSGAFSWRKGFRYLGKLLLPGLYTIVYAVLFLLLWDRRLMGEPFMFRMGWLIALMACWGIGYLAILHAVRLISVGKGRVVVL